ncbi:UDP-glucose 4-epimerase [Jannaschia seohaensis]|uniref:UDP-glucose 4-epimerase n=2 Tax=Jannaschia seohaensis TaxID=475081 RepID=A0A2Y9B4Y5_9RHOB|nr:UDP-glucose 4-epimerase [Jannaschia seohaensis]SSA51471.1 UDP-glucose 4-epimerase [Jannaschia seohaensis]
MASVKSAMQATRPDLVVHAAAATPDAAREAAGDAAAILDINAGGTARVIESAASLGVRRVIALSSVAVYGRTLEECAGLDEEMPPSPKVLYAISKLSAEMLALRLGAVHGVSVLTPRLGVLWGPWEHRTGERATPSPVYCMVEAARSGRDVVLPFPASAPLCEVSAAREMLLALIETETAEGVVNVGADRSVDLLEMAERVARAFGVRAEIDAGRANVPFFAVNRPPMRLGRLAAMTGRRFDVAPIDEALDRYFAWLDGLDGDGVPCPRR